MPSKLIFLKYPLANDHGLGQIKRKKSLRVSDCSRKALPLFSFSGGWSESRGWSNAGQSVCVASADAENPEQVAMLASAEHGQSSPQSSALSPLICSSSSLQSLSAIQLARDWLYSRWAVLCDGLRHRPWHYIDMSLKLSSMNLGSWLHLSKPQLFLIFMMAPVIQLPSRRQYKNRSPCKASCTTPHLRDREQKSVVLAVRDSGPKVCSPTGTGLPACCSTKTSCAWIVCQQVFAEHLLCDSNM